MLWIRGMARKTINIAANWASEQELQFSMRTEIVLFTHKRNPELGSLSMNGSKLELSKEARLFGVTLDSKLTWKPHIKRITCKPTTAVMQCRQIVGKTWGIKSSIMKWIYTAMIRPIMSYVCVRGGVEDTRLEAKAKDPKKIRGQGQGQPFRGQTLSRLRTGMLEAKAKDQGHKRKCSPKKKKKKKKKVFTKIFQAISTKKRFPRNFSSAPQNFNNSKNSAVLEPRTGQFSRTWGLEAKAKDLTFEAKAKDFKIGPRGRPRGQGRPRGLHLWYVCPGLAVSTKSI